MLHPQLPTGLDDKSSCLHLAIVEEVSELIASHVSSPPSLCCNGSARFIFTHSVLVWFTCRPYTAEILAMEPFLGHAVPVAVIHLV